MNKYAFMKNRSQRLYTIQEIIKNSSLSTQGEILTKLKQRGIQITQATLSRDLKLLRVNRLTNESGRSVYGIYRAADVKKVKKTDAPSLTESIISLNFANALALLKTLPGYASCVAVRIDQANPIEIVGTIAGDDTILIVPREGIPRTQVKDRLFRIFPGLKSRIR
jgi:transcriptional regulator of arginine metabolism